MTQNDREARPHYLTPRRRTPFHPRTAEANRLNHWAPWAGYTSALEYDDVAMEHSAIRNAATVYDISPMMKYRVTGPGATAFLNRLTLRDVAKLAVGAVHYTVWCDDAGKIIDDGTLFRLAGEDYRLCCQERHLPWLLDSMAGFDVAVTDETEEIAALSLQGPCSWSVLDRAGFDVADLRPFRMRSLPFGGGQVMISRTGFTGDLGYELWTDPDHALALWDRLFEAGAPFGIRPIGSHALDIARIEAGFIVTNSDFIPVHQAVREDRARSPFEMGLDWMIDWEKGHFNGRRALLAERAAGSQWAFVGLDIEGNVPAEQSLVYHDRRREVGHITAACWSPALKRNIALAQLRQPYHAGKSGNLWVEVYALRELQYIKLMLRARVCDRPFFRHPRRTRTPPAPF
ncbi:MAG: aminomethyl transferase family protein [Rhodobacteraceae bacterium]|nr:MAG: aminomethyl transferase family protein [Paracoccaceae bacterium]